jgi:hypothetical protein
MGLCEESVRVCGSVWGVCASLWECLRVRVRDCGRREYLRVHVTRVCESLRERVCGSV